MKTKSFDITEIDLIKLKATIGNYNKQKPFAALETLVKH